MAAPHADSVYQSSKKKVTSSFGHAAISIYVWIMFEFYGCAAFHSSFIWYSNLWNWKLFFWTHKNFSRCESITQKKWIWTSFDIFECVLPLLLFLPSSYYFFIYQLRESLVCRAQKAMLRSQEWVKKEEFCRWSLKYLLHILSNDLERVLNLNLKI